MNQRDNLLYDLIGAIYNGRTEDVAHLLIHYEVRDPTISDSIYKLVKSFDFLDVRSKAKLLEAVMIRRIRLGDALWFSRI